MEQTYISEGNVAQVVPAMLMLAVGMGVTTMVQIFLSVMSGQLYQNVETDIDAITNTTTKNYIKNSINYSFKAQQTQAQYQNILVIAAVLSVALVLIFGAVGSLGLNFGGGYGGYGGYNRGMVL